MNLLQLFSNPKSAFLFGVTTEAMSRLKEACGSRRTNLVRRSRSFLPQKVHFVAQRMLSPSTQYSLTNIRETRLARQGQCGKGRRQRPALWMLLGKDAMLVVGKILPITVSLASLWGVAAALHEQDAGWMRGDERRSGVRWYCLNDCD